VQQLELDDLCNPSWVHLQCNGNLRRNPIRVLFHVSVDAGNLRAAGGLPVDSEHDTMQWYSHLFVPHDAIGLRAGYRLHLEGRRLRRNAHLFHLCRLHYFQLLHRRRMHLGLCASNVFGDRGPILRCHDDEHLLLQFVHGLYVDCRDL
jgi:hypothetical protein